MILIWLPEITNRAKFIFKLFFTELAGLEYDLTSSLTDYAAYNGPKICYANEPAGDGVFIKSNAILFQKSVVYQEPSISQVQDVPVLFAHSDPRSSLTFDPFAASFYMVTRYEEYLDSDKDRFGRFKVSDSVAYEGKFLHIPVVHHWLRFLLEAVLRQFPQVYSAPGKFRFIPSIDIDHAYAYGHRTLTRTVGGYMRDLQRSDFKSMLQRTRVLFGREKDPYDTYDLLKEIHGAYGITCLYFILYADYGGNDNNVSLSDKEFRLLIKQLDRYGEVGIHPSFSSNRRLDTLDDEIYGLASLLNRDLLISRQHFLKFSMPWTYRNLIKMGITNDYSMGYATTPGFRAGIAEPFFFFDLITNEETEFIIHPVTVMDVSLKDYLNLDPGKSLEYIKQMIDTVKSVNGEFVSLWHNESFSDSGRWKGWKNLYEEMLKYALR
jgi:hypothetical protein